MSTLKKIACLFMLLAVSSMGAFAQTEEKLSDLELKQFASAFQQVQIVNQEVQQTMVKALEEKGLEAERYNEIQQAQQDPNMKADASAEEIAKYESASKELEKLQVEAQQKMQEKIIEEGLTVPRYQEIAAVIQSSPELQQKIQEFLQG